MTPLRKMAQNLKLKNQRNDDFSKNAAAFKNVRSLIQEGHPRLPEEA